MGAKMEEQGRPKKANYALRILVFLVLLVFILVMVILAITGMAPSEIQSYGLRSVWQRVASAMGEEAPMQQILFTLPQDEPEFFIASQGENLLLATTGEIRSIGESGEELWSRPVQLEQPFLAAHGDDVLYADLGGRTFGIIRAGAAFIELQSTNLIYNAAISRDFILVLQDGQAEGYTAILQGYTRDGVNAFTSYITDYTPFLVRHTPETGQNAIIMSGISTTNLVPEGSVEFIAPDMTRLGGLSAEDDLFAVVMQLDSGKTALVSEKSVRIVDRELMPIGNYASEGNPITAATLLGGKSPVIAVLDSMRYDTSRSERTWLRFLLSTGMLQREIVIEGKVTKLLSGGDFIGVITDRNVSFLDEEGEKIAAFDAKQSITDLVMTDSGNAFILADGQIILFRLQQSAGFLGLF